MWREIANRLMQGLLVLFVLGTLTFFLVHALPYGPFQDEKAIPDNVRERLEQIHGYDKPLLTQYWLRLNNIVRGDLGTSIKVMEGREVSDILLQALAAIRKNRAPDYIIMAVALLGICLPNFVIGPLLAEFFGGRLGWFPVSGWDPRSPSAMFLPALTLGLVSAAYLSRLTRAGMLEILHQDFIRTARAKGQKGHIIIIRHALRGGLIPSIAFLGPAFAGTISGSVVVESIFQIPGIGRLFIKAIETGDETLIMGPVLLYGTLIVTANFLVDLIQLWLNPRLRARAAA
ncbi:MAG: ABC transporter permease [Akkermansiaceae bacterium]|nr:ABC transporter permease [Akkermansiaceae bacterium]